MSKATIRIQTCFAPGKEKYEDRKISEPFATGIIDPDWPYTLGPQDGGDGYTRYHDKEKNVYKAAEPLTIQRLGELPVGKLVGGYLLMWTVSPFLIGTGVKPIEVEGKVYPSAALYLLEQWGFEPCSMLTWGKYRLDRIRNGEPSGGYGGVGFWFFGSAEYVIVAKKPGMPSIRTGTSSLFLAPKQKHTAKPDYVRNLAETRFPEPYLEIFGRYGEQFIGKDEGEKNKRKRWVFPDKPKNWTVLGDQAVGIKESGYGEDIFDSVENLLGKK